MEAAINNKNIELAKVTSDGYQVGVAVRVRTRERERERERVGE